MKWVPTSNRRRTALLTLAVLVCLVAAAAAQRQFFYGWDESVRNIPYDGRFTFVRVSYTRRARRLLGRRPAVVGPRLSARRAEPDEDHERDQLPRRAHADDINVRHARRSGAVQVSDRLHHRGRLVDADRSRDGGAARLPAEGRLPDRRRLQGARLARIFRRRLGAVRGQHEARVAGRAVLRDGSGAIRSSTRSSRSRRSTTSRRPTTAASRCSAAFTRTTIRPSG